MALLSPLIMYFTISLLVHYINVGKHKQASAAVALKGNTIALHKRQEFGIWLSMTLFGYENPGNHIPRKNILFSENTMQYCKGGRKATCVHCCTDQGAVQCHTATYVQVCTVRTICLSSACVSVMYRLILLPLPRCGY